MRFQLKKVERKKLETDLNKKERKFMEYVSQTVQDFYNGVPFDEETARAINTMKTMDIPILNGKKVLEIGCGTGELAVLMAKAGADVTAIEFTDVHIQRARQRAAQENVDIKFIHDNLWDYDFPEETYDMTFIMGVLHHTPFTEKALNKVITTTKTNGRIFFTIYNKYGSYPMRIKAKIIKSNNFSKDECGRVHPYTKLYSIQEILDMIAGKGVELVMAKPRIGFRYGQEGNAVSHTVIQTLWFMADFVIDWTPRDFGDDFNAKNN